MADHVQVKFQLQAPGLTLDTFAWSDLREFIDRLLPALAAMDGGPTPTQVLPVRLEAGSVRPVLRVPASTRRAIYRFRDGPTRSWTRPQLNKAGRVYDFLNERGLELRCGTRSLKPVTVPRSDSPWRIRELTTLIGYVRRAGGKQGRVEIVFDEAGHTVCDAGRPLAKQLGNHLYERVAVTGAAEWNAATSTLASFTIESFSLVEPTDFQAGLKELRAILGADMADFDPEAFLQEIRG